MGNYSRLASHPNVISFSVVQTVGRVYDVRYLWALCYRKCPTSFNGDTLLSIPFYLINTGLTEIDQAMIEIFMGYIDQPAVKQLLTTIYFIFIDCEAREIIRLVVSICPSVRPSVCPSVDFWTVWDMTLIFGMGSACRVLRKNTMTHEIQSRTSVCSQ